MAGNQLAVVVEVGGALRSYSAGGRDLVGGYGADETSSSARGPVRIPWPNPLLKAFNVTSKSAQTDRKISRFPGH
jgi:hypothetical protein